MFKLTQEQWLQYVRIAIQWGAASTGTMSYLNGSWGQFALATALGVAGLLWTAYATRIAGKINELVGAQVITTEVGEKMKDVADDPNRVVSKVETKPAPTTT